MARISSRGEIVETSGELPATGSRAPDFSLRKADLSLVTLADYAGSRLVLNIFPSIDTPTCAKSVRQFNERAAEAAIEDHVKIQGERFTDFVATVGKQIG